MQKITVHTQSQSYPIYIDEGLIEDSQLLQRHIGATQVMLVTNETIAPLFLDKVRHAYRDLQCDSVILPDGEIYKNLEYLNKIFDGLLAKRHHRSTTLVAIGGGVIGDMVGFAASCYQRGVAFVQIPTSLLSQVDASVGGKTAVNHPLGKNMIGAFYQPQCVIIDTQSLDSLPAREFSAGLGEVIKYGLICHRPFFDWLEAHLELLLKKDKETLKTTIARCCEIKADIVKQDEKEAGIRAILNFGHTIGHALETGLGYGVLLHGEAVAIGMIGAAEISLRLGHLSGEEVSRIKNCIEKAGLPTCISAELSTKRARELMGLDKKISDNKLRFILLNKIGESFISNGINEHLLDEVLIQCGCKE